REIEEADIEVGTDDVLREGQHDPGGEHRAEDEGRRGEEEPGIGRARTDVLFGDELDRVREGLEQAERADVVRAQAVLDDRLDLPLQVDLEQRAVQHQEERERDGDDKAQRPPDERIETERPYGHRYPPRASLRGG